MHWRSKYPGLHLDLQQRAASPSAVLLVPLSLGVPLQRFGEVLISPRLAEASARRDPVRSKYSADPQVSIVQQVVTVTANRSQPWLSPNVFPLCA